MNCATTCNTGSCRCSKESTYKRQANRNIPRKVPHIEETDQVWIEAGFIPPADYRRAVALLHRLAMDEEPTASLLSSVLTITITSGERDCDYRILDPAKFWCTAEEYGIEPGNRSDGEIAHAVTLAIIGEYGEKTQEASR